MRRDRHSISVALWVLSAGLLAQFSLAMLGIGGAPIRSDGVSYHVYLPALVLHADPMLGRVANDVYGGAFPAFTGILQWPNTSHWLNPHPMGVAILALPFFLVAHVLTLWSNLPPDGFSRYYQIGACLSGLCYGAAGLALLQRLLERFVSRRAAVMTLVALTWGTNLFHYLTMDVTYSHAYAFFLIAALLYVTDGWWRHPSRAHTWLLGLTAGLLVLTRHSHAMVLIVPALYGAGVDRRWSDHARALWARRAEIVSAAIVAAAVCVPQWWLYRAVTGAWLASPYALVPGGTDLGAPRVFDVWFSTAKGVFFWSPLLLTAAAGLLLPQRVSRISRWSTLIVFALLTIIIGAWHDWQFGGSYGHRGFTDILPLLALPLAGVITWLSDRPRPVGALAALVGAALVALSVFQMLQYWRGIIPFSDTTWEQYRALFLQWS